jgi:hypothetical protein
LPSVLGTTPATLTVVLVGSNIVGVATVAIAASFVALAISVYNTLAARRERLQAKRADLHVGHSTVLLDGDDYLVELRVTNVGRGTVPYLTVSLVSAEGQRLSEPVRAKKGLPADEDVELTIRLRRATVPPRTPVVHAMLAWDDPSGYDHLKVSGHRVRLDQAQERQTEADPQTAR